MATDPIATDWIALGAICVGLPAFASTWFWAVPETRALPRTKTNTLAHILQSVWHEAWRSVRGRLALASWCVFIFTTILSISVNISGASAPEALSWITLVLFVAMNLGLAASYYDASWIQDRNAARFCQIIPMR